MGVRVRRLNHVRKCNQKAVISYRYLTIHRRKKKKGGVVMISASSGNIASIFIFVPIMGALSFFSPRVLSVFPTKIGYISNYTEHNIRKSFLYSLFISIGFMFVLSLLGIVSITLPGIAKWLYLFFCIVIMHEGMQLIGIVKLSSIIPSYEKSFKGALFIGTFGGFLLFKILTRVLNAAFGFMGSTKLFGIIVFVAYAIGQSVLLLSLELMVSIINNTPYPNTQSIKSRNKLIKTILGVIFIFMGFILSYFGFSYDF